MESHPMHEIPYSNEIFKENSTQESGGVDEESYLTMFRIPRPTSTLSQSPVNSSPTSLYEAEPASPNGADTGNGKYRRLSVGSATSSLYRHQIKKSKETRRWLIGCLAVTVAICAILAVVVIVLIALYSKKGSDGQDIPLPSAESLKFTKMHFGDCQVLPDRRAGVAATPYFAGKSVPARAIQSCSQDNPNPRFEVHCLAQDASNSTVTVQLSQKGSLTGVVLVLLSSAHTAWRIVDGGNLAGLVSIVHCKRDVITAEQKLIKQNTNVHCQEGPYLSDDVASAAMKEVQQRYGDITSFTYTRQSDRWELLVGQKSKENTAQSTTTTTPNPSPTEDNSQFRNLVSVRLADGHLPTKGHVQLLLNDHWYYLCEDKFDFADAQVVCRTLGFGDRVTLQRGTYYNTVASNPLHVDLNCNGHEDNITECDFRLLTSRDSCLSNDVAAITCIPDTTTPAPSTVHQSLLTDVRLVSGSVEYEGNVQVRYGSTWRYLCNSYWSKADANVICNSLGFRNAATIYHFSYFGSTPTGDPPVFMLNCHGEEKTVSQCAYTADWNSYNAGCSPTTVAGVTCQGGPIKNFSCTFETGFCGMQFDTTGFFAWARTNGSTSTYNTGPDTDHTTGTGKGFYTFYESSYGIPISKLSTPKFMVNGSSVYNVTFWYHMQGSTMGTLRVYQNGSSSSSIVWQRQGDRGNLWHYAEIHLVAKENFTIVFEAVRGKGSFSDIALDDIFIKEASEITNLEIPSEKIEVRLTGGRSIYEGRVEVQYLGEWGSVCGDGWNMSSALVICRMLGSSGVIRSYSVTNYLFGPANGTVWLRDVACTGNETSLGQCQHPGWEDAKKYGCYHNFDAAVKCRDPRDVGADCTFENGMCDFSQDDDDVIDWALHPGGSTAVQTDPVIDHTLGTVSGYYIYLESANAVPGDKGRITTPTIKNNSTRQYSISFWFYMNNGQTARQASLAVYLLVDGNIEKKLWEFTTKRGGTDWRFHYLNETISNDFKVVFEGSIHSSNFTGTVRPGLALDDIFISDNEGNFGKMLNAESIRLSGGLDPWEGRVEVYHGGVWGTICDDGWDITDATVACRMLGYSDAEFAYPKAYFGTGSGRIWLDNVDCLGHEGSLEHCHHSGWGRLPLCTHDEDAGVRCKVPESFKMGVSSMNCTFEEGLCGFVDFTPNYTPYAYNWTRYMGRTPTGYTGPTRDHTLGNTNGHYIYTEGSNVLSGLKAKIASPTINPGNHGTYNVSFWVTMFGRHVGALRVFLRLIDSNRTNDLLLWKHSGSLGHEWILGHFLIHTKSKFKVIFESVRGNGYLSDIALDDINIHPQKEKEFSKISCTFEHGLCDFVQDLDAAQLFTFNRGNTLTPRTGPESDHTLGTVQGIYVYLEASNNHFNDSARLISPKLRKNMTYAVTFWYHLFGDNVGSLSVYVEVNGTKRGNVWSVSGNHGNVWLRGSVVVNGTENSYVVFEGRLGTAEDSDIALDDITIEPVLGSNISALFTTPVPPPVPVRLVQGAFPWEGRVEVYHLGQWGTVCHDEWDINDAHVVCRMLGYSNASKVYSGARFGAGSGVTWLDNVRCHGDEMSILDCSHNGWAMEDCSHLQDAGVRCTAPPSATTPTPVSTTLYPQDWCHPAGTLDGVNPYRPHPGNCSMFLICFNNGIVGTTICPAGEFFSPNASLCVPARNMSNQCSPDGFPLSSHGASSCQAGWSQFQRHCYKYFNDTKHYVDAMVFCKIHDGDMVSILSEDEQQFVGTLVGNNTAPDTYVYIGYNTIQTMGQWDWVDGSMGYYDNWAVLDFQPDPSSTGERCAAMTTEPSKTWYDRSCLEELPFICKAKTRV
ncbi:uncharacterized protein LOC106172943 isoform X2 [Lingula anatina]|nr:uncharacterized protein LOC106172943 isoform X2 [Lingula anatina]|eukprot:XP_013409345.1 uncharacterized protein LOC106172943 isoform X2 [Lingula anatina]